MATKKYDVCAGRQGTKDGKVFWTRIGVVLQTEKGFSLKLEQIPVGWDGWAKLFEPKDKTDAPATPVSDIDADVPFAPIGRGHAL